jgi:hypothetical protein
MMRLSRQGRAADIFCDVAEDRCIHLAVDDLAGDIERVTGVRPAIRHGRPEGDQGFILVGDVRNPAFRRQADAAGIGLSALDGRVEAYRIQTWGSDHGNLLLCGSDERGTMWAIYEFAERFLGIDPVGFWTDHEPAQQAGLAWDRIFREDAPRAFGYRGWFLNDEVLLTEWKNGGGTRSIDYPFYRQVTHPDVLARVLETALRLKQNLLIPASFVDIDNPPEANLLRMATERGLLVTQHHIEALGVSHFSLENYWKKRGEATPSFLTDRGKVEETWDYYARQWAAFGDRVIWQLGLRGRGDRPVWEIDPTVPATAAARGALISEAIASQRRIVTAATGRTDFVSTTTLWDEGAALYEAGHLEVPPGTIVVFSDNLRTQPPGAVQRIFAHQWAGDFYRAKRSPDRPGGIYYHVAFWSTGPHLAHGVPLDKIGTAYREAFEKGDTAYALVNVGNLREVIKEVEAASRLGWDTAAWSPEIYAADWYDRQFGAGAGPAAVRLEKIFAGAYTKVPTENPSSPALGHDGVIASQGLSLLRDLRPGPAAGRRREKRDFSAFLTQDRLPGWRHVRDLAGETENQVPPPRRAFFRHHFGSQADIMLALTEWHAAVVRAWDALEAGTPDHAARCLDRGADALAAAMDQVRRETAGRWKHWYRGDRKLNLAGLVAETRDVARELAAAG